MTPASDFTDDELAAQEGAFDGPASFQPGDWVEVLPEHDIPPMFRPDGKPTRGRVDEVTSDCVMVYVPIGGADVDEHSQAVPYEPRQLTKAASDAVQ